MLAIRRHHGGQYILRIEDTDRERSTEENVDAILDGMSWLGIESDEGPYYQSHRSDRYREVIDQWLSDGRAYHCYCSKEELSEKREQQIANGENPRYDGRCRAGREPPPGVDPVVRFRNPEQGTVVVDDLVRGEVTFGNEELDDLIIARSDGSSTYNFTVVVDDADMQISHVIRGDDHLNNTPKQMNMIEALGVELPRYAHLPMILGEDGSKLSKRHGAVDVREYRERGYLPNALLNYLVRLGWSHGNQEIFTLDEMIDLFDIADVNQSASTFNKQKLRWLNQQYIISAPAVDVGNLLQPFLERSGYDLSNGPSAARVAEAFHERAETLEDMATSASYCFNDPIELDPAAAKKQLRPVILKPLMAVRDALAGTNDWQREELGRIIRRCAEAHEIGMGKIGQPVRVAITGGSVSPPIDVTLELIGKDRVLERLARAIALVESRVASTRS